MWNVVTLVQAVKIEPPLYTRNTRFTVKGLQVTQMNTQQHTHFIDNIMK